jgi:uncharacterized protein (DUF58 family)
MRRRASLDPRVLARIGDLRLLAQLVVDGYLHGAHDSRQHGSGIEFSQYRAYEPGDDPRQIDWKLYGRSDRVYVRQAERESQLALWLLVDTSASMRQASGQIADWSRLHCARALAASLGYLAHRQGDAVGLVGLSEEAFTYLPARAGAAYFDALVHALDTLPGGRCWPSAGRLAALWGGLDRPGLVVLISDFLQADREIESLCGKLRAAGKEVLTLQLLTRDELAFPWRGSVAFVDPENGAVVEADGARARAGYRRRVREELARLDRVLTGLGLFCQRAIIEDPLDEILLTFLQRRGRATVAGARGTA